MFGWGIVLVLPLSRLVCTFVAHCFGELLDVTDFEIGTKVRETLENPFKFVSKNFSSSGARGL